MIHQPLTIVFTQGLFRLQGLQTLFAATYILLHSTHTALEFSNLQLGSAHFRLFLFALFTRELDALFCRAYLLLHAIQITLCIAAARAFLRCFLCSRDFLLGGWLFVGRLFGRRRLGGLCCCLF